MITSRQILELSEIWSNSVKSLFTSKRSNIYLNPDSGDCRELAKSKVTYVRFLASDRVKQVYVADANSLLHADMVKTIPQFHDLNTEKSGFSSWCLSGTAKLSGGKLEMISSDVLLGIWNRAYDISKQIELNVYSPGHVNSYKLTLTNILKVNWSWVDNCVKVSGWLSGFKKDVEELKG